MNYMIINDFVNVGAFVIFIDFEILGRSFGLFMNWIVDYFWILFILMMDFIWNLRTVLLM